MSLALCTRKFKLCLAKSHESLTFTAVLAAPLAFVLPANTQLLGLGIPVCSASPLLPLVPPQKAGHGFGETTRDQLEETSRKWVGVAIGPWRMWKCGVFGSCLCSLWVISVTWENFITPLWGVTRVQTCLRNLLVIVQNANRACVLVSCMWSAGMLALFR